MLLSDFVGFVSGALLVVPPGKDQVLRYREAWESKRADHSMFKPLRAAAAIEWRRKREGYDGIDALLTVGGAFLLLLTFFLKIIEL